MDFRIEREKVRFQNATSLDKIFNFDYAKTHTSFDPAFEPSRMQRKTVFTADGKAFDII